MSQIHNLSMIPQGHLAFGYGRRTCVGNSVANNTLFVNIATLLWAFNIEKGKDATGKTITPDVNNFIDHVNVKYVFFFRYLREACLLTYLSSLSVIPLPSPPPSSSGILMSPSCWHKLKQRGFTCKIAFPRYCLILPPGLSLVSQIFMFPCYVEL